MADFTLSSGNVCKPFRSPWGAFPTRGFKVSTGVSSATIHEGRPVTLDYTEAGNTSNAGYVKASTGDNTFYLAGIAAGTISGSSATVGVTEVSVWEANPMVEFKAVTKGATLDLAQVGLHKKLMRDSTLDIEYVDLSASTAADWRVVITGLIDGVGDSGGYVSFRFLSRLTENTGSSVAITSTSPVLAFYA